MQLFNFHRSSASWRVRIALALKGLDYEYIAVRLDWNAGRSANYGADYKALNPQGVVPLLVDGGLRIGQTLAILDYLDRKHPDPPLYPHDDAGRARVLGLAAWIAAEIQPLQNIRVERYLANHHGLGGKELAVWRGHWIALGFDAVEQTLGDGHAGAFCHGDTPGAADCFLVPQALNARRSRMDLAAWPRLQTIVDTCLQHPAFRDTAGDRMPDYEPMPGQ